MSILYPGNQVWLRNYRRGEKGTIKGTMFSKVGTVMYKVKCCNEKYKKHIDQSRFHPDIEAELEVKDTSQLEQNLSLHLIPIVLNQIRVIKQVHHAHQTVRYQMYIKTHLYITTSIP